MCVYVCIKYTRTLPYVIRVVAQCDSLEAGGCVCRHTWGKRPGFLFIAYMTLRKSP